MCLNAHAHIRCPTLGASLFTAGTNLDGGLMELSTDRKHVHEENSARRVETRTMK